ncbi:Triple Functional Domain Protein [Manis pentadactyla]|nr:Triple Functional Domain Protein [Manis pentadactyla]
MKPPGPESRSGRPREAAAHVATRGRRSPAALQGARGPCPAAPGPPRVSTGTGDAGSRPAAAFTSSCSHAVWEAITGTALVIFPYLSPGGGSRSPAAARAAWQTRAGRPDLRPRRSDPYRPRAPGPGKAPSARPAPPPPRPQYTWLPRARCRAAPAPGGSPTAPPTCSLHVEGTMHLEGPGDGAVLRITVASELGPLSVTPGQ